MKFIALLFVVLGGSSLWAEEAVFLDPDYGTPRTPMVLDHHFSFDLESQDSILESALRVEPIDLIKAQSPVKSQGRRGTCSIFSTTAILEYYLEKMEVTGEDPDLSEQWLEYITAGQRGSEGSWSYVNFDLYGRHGYVSEDKWAYNPLSWYPYDSDYWEISASEEAKAEFDATCGSSIDTPLMNHCLIGQRDSRLLNMSSDELVSLDDEFLSIRTTAQENLSMNQLSIRSQWMGISSDIQAALDRGEVVSLDVTFFYEAWNHSKSLSLGLQRDFELWAQGVVSYPSPDSMDYRESRKSENRAGHSVVLVGYDKDVVIEREVQDVNGEPLTVRTKGVYYFKNSWGQDSFGVDFTLEEENFPGFGMISMDYAHEYGSFYSMVVRQNESF